MHPIEHPSQLSPRLNAVIKPIWDHLDAGVRKIIEDEVGPALQKRLGPTLGHWAAVRLWSMEYPTHGDGRPVSNGRSLFHPIIQL